MFERERIKLLGHAKTIIQEYFKETRVTSVYITGSIIKPYTFGKHSDIDIATEGLPSEIYFKSVGQLTEILDRQVEIIELEQCRFADKIKKTGIKII
jgi:predicted nucleotidyltransferase